jgi:uncharacterized glyoxalase superfamily protein PhnB
MSKRPPRPAGFPWLSPYLTVTDADAAIAFYQRAFGFEKRMSIPGPDGKTGHVEMTWKDSVIMFGPECPHSPSKAPASLGVPSPVGLYLYCEDVDALYKRATAAGAKGVKPPEDMFYGDRVCQLTDPDGHTWWFATNVADFDPSKMPKQ